MLPRVRRDRIATNLRAIAANPNYDEALFGPRTCLVMLADQIAPHRGHRFTFAKTFEKDVDAWMQTLSVGKAPIGVLSVRTHLLADHRRQNPAVSRKLALKCYLLNFLGRAPTEREIANAQAIYCQRTRRKGTSRSPSSSALEPARGLNRRLTTGSVRASPRPPPKRRRRRPCSTNNKARSWWWPARRAQCNAIRGGDCSARKQTKLRRVLAAFVAGRSLNRFDAARDVRDWCLHSTVSELESKGVRIDRAPEVVPGHYGPVHCKRYRLAPDTENVAHAKALLGARNG